MRFSADILLNGFRTVLIGCVSIASILPLQAKDNLPTSRIRRWVLPYPTALADTVTMSQDTAYINFPMRDALYDYSICNTYNGNLVAPVQSAIYFRRTKKTECIFADAYDPYTVTPQNVRFANTTTPFSRISYKKGFTTYHEDNDLSFAFIGNLSARTNLGVNIDYLNAAGHYKNQAGKVVNGAVFGSYNGNHYSLQSAFTFATLKNFENGGLRNPEDIQSSLSTGDIPVNLNAMSGYRYLAGYVNHYYSICNEREEKVRYKERDQDGQWQQKDSIRVDYVPMITFRHVFDVNEQNRRYIEQSANQYFYSDIYRNTKSTNDSAATLTIRNTLSVTFEEEFNTKLKFGAVVYAYNECQRYLMADGLHTAPVELLPFGSPLSDVLAVSSHLRPDTIYGYQWFNNTFVGGELYKNRGRYLKYGFGGDVCVLGYKMGEFQVNGHLNGGFRIGKDSMTISAAVSFSNEKPDFYLTHYLSNHFRWDNEFQNTLRLRVGGQIAYPTKWVTPGLRIDYENLTRYIYFNSKGLPEQTERNVSVFSADVQLNVTTPWVNLDNSIVYQYASSAVVPLPTVALYSNLYYHGVWFKAMDAQIGADIRYNTAYYAPVICPATGQFCVQDEQKVGNYPVMSVYANFYIRLIRLRFFAKYQHFNASFMNHQYFTMPNYPLNPGVFCAGLAFHFYK